MAEDENEEDQEDNSGSDSDDDEEDEAGYDDDSYKLSVPSIDLLLAIRAKTLDPAGDADVWAGKMVRDLLTSPVDYVVLSTLSKWGELYVHTNGNTQRVKEEKHEVAPIVVGLLDHPDERIRDEAFARCVYFGDGGSTGHFRENVFYSPGLLDRLKPYLG